ncbi:hypothetical protein FRD01_17110 [Microvenator marinus]|uniref:Uncharacterized protein n=1 Tax=Microvenator marinus TaxID=2600177 RepID=A0A5B8XVH3_9DELT|nr:hypothetical protein [Microvenator marinus]QED28928.1 hypothetical protein FRD01_17110 [Microvenator marinus]
MMWSKIATEASKNIWKEIGQDMLKKGAATVAVEGVKSVIEVYKKRKMMMDEFEFQEWKKSRSSQKTPEPEKSVPVNKDEVESEDETPTSSEQAGA